jgi:hypothetical protein
VAEHWGQGGNCLVYIPCLHAIAKGECLWWLGRCSLASSRGPTDRWHFLAPCSHSRDPEIGRWGGRSQQECPLDESLELCCCSHRRQGGS